MTPQPEAAGWLMENGPRELERLIRAIVFLPSASILLTDSDRRHREASVGAGKLFGLPREKIIGRRLDDFAEPGFRPVLSERWSAFLKDGEQEGTLRLVSREGPREVGYLAKGNILPVCHVLVLTPRDGPVERAEDIEDTSGGRAPASAHDYALFLLDVGGQVIAWYAGAERIYGHKGSEVIGQRVPFFDPAEDSAGKLEEKLEKAAREGHAVVEGWQVKKDGSRFQANVILMSLNDENGILRGFAGVVRDFTGLHERNQRLRRGRARLRPLSRESSVAGIISGEFDRIPEANDAFLELAGYSREDLHAGVLHWPDLTPTEYTPLDELAHEEGLRFGACTPFEKELIRKGWDADSGSGCDGSAEALALSMDYVCAGSPAAKPV